MTVDDFVQVVWDYYAQHGRDLPWRADGLGAYEILVSEIMLQQTQASRVVPKYQAFLKQFPTVQALASAPLADVLAAWSGLGYNRRAKYLHEAAKQLAGKPEPWIMEDFVGCKGIGHNTAAAVVTYAYNQPIPFIETNIRTVFIHHFFADADKIPDRDVLPFVEQALDKEHPREWNWALMDYGVFVKRTVGNASRASKHYTRQSAFHGSRRQVRGQVLRLLGQQPQAARQLAEAIGDERVESVVEDLLKEGMISQKSGVLQLG